MKKEDIIGLGLAYIGNFIGIFIFMIIPVMRF